MFWIGFGVGLVCGSTLGLFIAAFLAASKMND